MRNRASAALIVAVLALVGFNLADLQVLVTNYFLGRDLPSTLWFRVVFWIWVVTALGLNWCGVNGGYVAIRSGELANWYLKAFLVMLCFMIRVDGKDLGWSAFRLSFFFGLHRFAVGVNLVGVAGYLWYMRLLGLTSRPLRPPEPSDAPSRAV